MRFILLDDDRMQKIPKEVEVIKTIMPNQLENIRLRIIRSIITQRVSFL